MIIVKPTFLVDFERYSNVEYLLRFKNKVIIYDDVLKNKKDVRFKFTSLIIMDKTNIESNFIGYNSIINRIFVNFPINNDKFKKDILYVLFHLDFTNKKSLLRKIIELKKIIILSTENDYYRLKGNRFLTNFENKIIQLNDLDFFDIGIINKELYVTNIYIPLFRAVLEDI